MAQHEPTPFIVKLRKHGFVMYGTDDLSEALLLAQRDEFENAYATHLAEVVASAPRFAYFGTHEFTMRLRKFNERARKGVSPRSFEKILGCEFEVLADFLEHFAISEDRATLYAGDGRHLGLPRLKRALEQHGRAGLGLRDRPATPSPLGARPPRDYNPDRNAALAAIVPRLKALRQNAEPKKFLIGKHAVDRVEHGDFEIIFGVNPDGLYFAVSRGGDRKMTGYINPTRRPGKYLDGMVHVMGWKRGEWEARLFD